MQIKNKNYLISYILLIVTIIVSVFSTILNFNKVLAYGECFAEKYTGHEDATNVKDFNNNYRHQNAFKMWSVYKSLGMTDEEACACLGVAACEGSFYPELCEYAMGQPWEKGVNNSRGTGEHTHASANSRLNSNPAADSQEQFDNYVEVYCEPAAEQGGIEFSTDCVIDTLLSYGISITDIENARKPGVAGIAGAYEAWSPELKETLDISFYFYLDAELQRMGYTKGVGFNSGGIYGFTGQFAYKLMKWAESRDEDYWNIDTQIAYFIAPGGSDGYFSDNRFYDYIEECKNCDVDECVTKFVEFISGDVESKMPESEITKRHGNAQAAYEIFKGLKFDKDYARDILGSVDVDPVYLGSGIIDYSILGTFLERVIKYPQNVGMILDNSINDDILANNQEVFAGYINSLKGEDDTSDTYSLYELFGEDIHWYRYFGEKTYTPNLADHIWSAVDQNKTRDLISFDTIDYESNRYISCQVYPGRPGVLSSEKLSNGDTDPRTSGALKNIFTGWAYTDGSFKLEVCKNVVSLVTFVMGDGIKNAIGIAFKDLEDSKAWDIVKPLLFLILGLVMVFFIISLAGKAIRYSKGNSSFREILARFAIGVLCLGFFGTIVANPSAFNVIVDRTTGIIDSIFDDALSEDLQTDEVVAVKNNKLATSAAIWRRAIFGPWCRAQFEGRNYEELYTTYSSTESGQSRMPQSHDKIDMTAAPGTPFYDSAKYTGDVFVYAGGGKEIKNWAAYLYSCGSKYHIDSTINKKVAEKFELPDDHRDIYFPNITLKTTAGDGTISADTFRVIDAQMNISPQHFSNGNITDNYKDSVQLDPHFTSESFVMICNTSLLLLFLPVIWKKISSFVLLMATAFKVIYYTIFELFKEGKGLKDLLDSIKKHFINYVVACLKMCILVALYYKFVDQGFVKLVIFVIISIVVIAFDVKDLHRQGIKIKNAIRRNRSKFNTDSKPKQSSGIKTRISNAWHKKNN